MFDPQVGGRLCRCVLIDSHVRAALYLCFFCLILANIRGAVPEGALGGAVERADVM